MITGSLYLSTVLDVAAGSLVNTSGVSAIGQRISQQCEYLKTGNAKFKSCRRQLRSKVKVATKPYRGVLFSECQPQLDIQISLGEPKR